jgi:small-conductance mechanosensitive channel
VFDSTFGNRFRPKRQGLPNNRRLAPQLIAPISSSNAILNMMAETAEEISRRPEIRKELQRTTGEKRPAKVKARGRDKFWFIVHALVFAGCIAAYFLVGSKLIPLPQSIVGVVVRILRGAVLIVIVLTVARAISVYALARIEDPSIRFTLQRVMHLVAALAIAVIVISVIFVNWYAALAAFGIGSIIIGLAVQTPMKSFIAWIYILVRQPFRVGDRIQIGDATGDVIDVGYLDTTLWEFGGKYMSGDHPSGRLIKFPNEKVLDEIVYNYSWPLFPYIWNEIKFYIAFNADLEFVASTMQKITEEELGKEMIARVQTFRDLLARTPVDELEVHERPRVIFRVSENTWLEAIVRYLVPPREAGRVKTRLIKKLLAALNAAPDKVMFPAGANR